MKKSNIDCLKSISKKMSLKSFNKLKHNLMTKMNKSLFVWDVKEIIKNMI